MERHTRHRGAVCYGLLNLWSAVAVSESKLSIVGCNSGFLLASGGSMAARNRSGSLFFKCHTQTTRFNYVLGSVFLSASLTFSVAFCCDTVYWAFLFYRMGLPACFTDPPARHEPALLPLLVQGCGLQPLQLYINTQPHPAQAPLCSALPRRAMRHARNHTRQDLQIPPDTPPIPFPTSLQRRLMLQTLPSAWPLHLICRTEKGTLIHPKRARQSSCKTGVRRRRKRRRKRRRRKRRRRKRRRRKRRRRKRRRRKRRRRASHNISKDDDHSITNCQNIVT
jgi:hypothetical protein